MNPTIEKDSVILQGDEALDMVKVLASKPRLQILEILSTREMNISEIAKVLGMTQPSVSINIQKLEEVGMIKTSAQPGQQGSQKVCQRIYNNIVVRLPKVETNAEVYVSDVDMPIGLYQDISASRTCGLITDTEIIGILDDETSFLEPKRVYAQLLYFTRGYVEYVFPNNVPPGGSNEILSLELSMEICSEAPHHNPEYPSEIVIWINDVEIGTWLCPGDYGGERGRLTPEWWSTKYTQYGLLKRWTVNEHGSMIDGLELSSVTISELDLKPKKPIKVRIGIPDNSEYPGGINLFGEKFGNYPQNIHLRLTHRPQKNSKKNQPSARKKNKDE